MKISLLSFLIAAIVFFGSIQETRAVGVSMYLLPRSASFGIGQEFTVDIKIQTGEASINAAQAIIQVPGNMLKFVSIDKTNSAFEFWIQEPKISDQGDQLTFIGGTAKGVSGESLQILKIKLRAVGAGVAELSVLDAVVTASDGKGSNVLSAAEGASIAVGPGIVPALPNTALLTPVPTNEQPQEVVRVPIAAKDLPEEPKPRIPLYPDSAAWYNKLGEIIMFWDLPDDITNVATAFDQNSKGDPKTTEDGLFTGKNFGVLQKEGIWYAHVQFKNNVGWGPIAHYRIAVDTTPPLAFEIAMESQVSDNPAPAIQYETQDSLSGISHALVALDGKESLRITESQIQLSPQAPGEHTVRVRVFDFAGNSVQDDSTFEVLALPTPALTFITKEVSQNERPFVSGTAIPNEFVDIRVMSKSGQELFRGSAQTDSAGKWEIVIGESFPTGTYLVQALARDSRGAVSYPTEPLEFTVQPQTVISFGFVDLGWFEIVLFVILLGAAGGSAASWYYVVQRKKREAYQIIAGRDVEKLTRLLSEDLKKLGRWTKDSENERLKARAKPEIDFLIQSMGNTVEKMKKYLTKELEKLH